MAKFYKNRVTISFDTDHKFTVYLATLEQVNAFVHFFRRCIQVPFATCLQEALKEGEWAVTYEGKGHTHENNKADIRARTAPFRLNISIFESKNSKAFDFSMYFFSSADADYIGLLLEQGVSSEQISVTSQNRDRETGEWINREVGKFAPKSMVELYNTLDTHSRETVMTQMYELKQLQIKS